LLARSRFQGPLKDEDFQYLHDTHGLPRDLVTNLRQE
jgi:alanyl-tRNA synthetase